MPVAMRIRANGISLEVEDHGSPQGEPLVLVMGLGMQLTAWHEDFVAALVERGFRVIRFDNRDIGLSESFDAAGVPNLALASLRFALGLRNRSAYAIADMAADVVGLLDALGIEKAHVCGASMGGMIAQHLAFSHPERLKSVTLMMTTTGARRLPAPSLKVRGALIKRPKRNDFDAVLDHYVGLYGLIGSPAYRPDPEWLRARLTMSLRRAYRPAGTARQMMAIAADGDRSARVAGIAVPTHVIHGDADPLVPVGCGRDLAGRVGGATLDVIAGMGHDLPRELWPRFVDGIAGAAGRA
jgi:pimeloyl-ACP methyl ester carboxylesterase